MALSTDQLAPDRAQDLEEATANSVSPVRPTPLSLRQRITALFPGGQLVRYLLVGGFNTLFGYGSFVAILTLLSNIIPARYLGLSAVAASIISTPINITVAFFGYKFFVFRTKGNYLREWLKCFAVYGTSMIPGLLVLGALTRLLQGLIHRHALSLHRLLAAVEGHLSGAPLHLLDHIAHGKTMAGNIAGAILIAVTTVYSFIGHKKVTFATSSAA